MFSDNTFIIAEIGTSHRGDLNRAYKMIDKAGECGADCAKFQVVFADEIIHPKTGIVELPGGPTPLYDVFKSLEKDEEFFFKLKEHTEARGLTFLASPFGEKSAEILHNIGSECYKIASPELNHYPLIRKVASYGKPVILSGGVATLGDLAKAAALAGEKTALLHCITSYPAPEEEYNLRLIPSLKAVLGVETGISDHSLDPVLVPALSVLMGARIVEKHFTLDNRDPGLDDPVALSPQNFEIMCKAIRKYEKMDQRTGINELKALYTCDRIEKILGTGVKKLAQSELNNYGRTNRSLHALVDIKKGEKITKKNTALLRTEKILRPGVSPELAPELYDGLAAETIPEGEGIRLQDVIIK